MMTDEKLAAIVDFWFCPPGEFGPRYVGKGPLRNAKDDIRDLLVELQRMGRQIPGDAKWQLGMDLS